MAITITYTFTPNTTALSAEVNANFSLLASRATDKTGDTLTGTLNTQSFIPTTSNTYDLGSTSFFYRTGHVKTSLILGQTTANYTLTWANPASARAISFEDPLGTDIIVYKAATQTLTNKTLTAPTISGPTFSGTVIGTYTLGGTPTIPASGLTGTITSATQDLITRLGTITSGVWNAGAITSSGTIAGASLTAANNIGIAATGKLYLDGQAMSGDTYISESSANNLRITAGGAVSADFLAGGIAVQPTKAIYLDGGSDTYIIEQSANIMRLIAGNITALELATTSATIPATNKLYLDGGGDTWIYEAVANNIDLVAGGTTTLRISAGGLHFGANIADGIGTPTIASGFGTSPSIVGKSYGFRVTIGTGASTSGTVNFGTTFASAPICVAHLDQSGNVPLLGPVTTTQLPIQYLTGAAGQHIDVIVRGY